MGRGGRVRPWVVTAVAVGAVLSPLADRRDSFPLSDYPMFAGRRPVVVELAHVVGVRADGSVRVLPPSALGTREVVGALEIVRAAARDRDRAAELCAYVAVRVRGYESVAVRVDTYDTLRYFAKGRTALASRDVASCRASP